MPALLVTGLYGAALTVAAVVALVSGDLGPLWRLTLFASESEGVVATGQNLLLLIVAGMSWAWGMWQILRRPPAGPPPERDRDTRRLRVALYVATATTGLLHVTASWAGAAVVNSVAMWAVVLLSARVLGGDRTYTRGAGVLGYAGLTVIDALDLAGLSVSDGAGAVAGLAALAWTVMVLLAQRQDDRWGKVTVAYGIAALVMPFLLLLAVFTFPDEGSAVEALGAVSSALSMIWLARSAHDLAAPRHQPAAQPALGS
ncbi:hypothetical protein [Bailinhaonella thermotolerans]|uniref:Uncharacterized protein n=1 Tax=Bailinhaonella thermotolerans TaxID=1070861 RepID=A0A3A4B4K3_9ACTN|nr:hypothetical protein [Bailinhaonella thermotolerans]RJL33247.1 hypothetical protein D5H75_10495 [Bailinhaonella thermotolerans]